MNRFRKHVSIVLFETNFDQIFFSKKYNRTMQSKMYSKLSLQILLSLSLFIFKFVAKFVSKFGRVTRPLGPSHTIKFVLKFGFKIKNKQT